MRSVGCRFDSWGSINTFQTRIPRYSDFPIFLLENAAARSDLWAEDENTWDSQEEVTTHVTKTRE